MISPCIRLCAIDARSGLCAGCGRTLAEIGGWVGYTESERRAIKDALPARLAQMKADDAKKPA